MIFETFSPCYYGVFPIEKTFQICYWTCLTSQENFSFISITNYLINLLDLYFLEKWFFKVIWPYLNYNHLINSLKIPTKIWRCHVMFLKTLLCKKIFLSLNTLSSIPSFQIWSRGLVCTTTYLFISLKLLPKFWDVSGSILFSFMQKPSYVLWKIWVNHPHLHSGPTSGFVLQLYFNLLLLLWFLFLLVVHLTKPLCPGECTHWIIFGSWSDAICLLSKIEVLQNLH